MRLSTRCTHGLDRAAEETAADEEHAPRSRAGDCAAMAAASLPVMLPLR